MRPSRLTCSDSCVLHQPCEAIYRVLTDFGSYPEWWPSAGGIRVLGPLPVQVGTTVWLAYGPFVHWTAEVVELREPGLLALRYATGALRGVAVWHLAADGNGTRVTYAIDIEPTWAWLRLVGALWNLQSEHSRQITRVFAALDHRLAAVAARGREAVCCAAG